MSEPIPIQAPAEGAEYDRQPPFSPEAEASVLGGMLIDGEAVARVVEFVDDSMFYREAHRRIFRAMTRLFERRQRPGHRDRSPRTLKKRRRARRIAGGHRLPVVPPRRRADCGQHRVPRVASCSDKAMLRRLIDAAHDDRARGLRTETTVAVDEVLDQAEQTVVYRVSESRNREGVVRIKEVLWPTFAAHREVAGVAGGHLGDSRRAFADLDRMTTGLQAGDLAIVAGRPSMGKTSWALNVAQNAAIEHGVPVAIFSLEMSKEQLVQRFLCAEGRVNAQKLRRGRLEGDEYQRLARAAAHLNTAPIWIDDSATGNVLEMKAKSRRLKADAELGVIVVDYIQLMSGATRTDSRVQEVSEISRGLKAMARELEVPVIALSQLSRAPEQRPDRRPQLSDLRESGAIEQDADLVMFLYRPEYYYGLTDKDGQSLEGKAELIVAKQRNGPTGTVNLYFHKDLTRFDSVAREPERAEAGM